MIQQIDKTAVDKPELLTLPAPSSIMSGELARAYAELQIRILMTQLNWWRRYLGEQPKRCPNCGEIIK